jgi:hypothetical protein
MINIQFNDTHFWQEGRGNFGDQQSPLFFPFLLRKKCRINSFSGLDAFSFLSTVPFIKLGYLEIQ